MQSLKNLSFSVVMFAAAGILSSHAFADLAYYPLNCEITGSQPQLYTSVASFTNKVVQIDGKSVTIPVCSGVSVIFRNLPCAWETSSRRAAPVGTPVPSEISAIVSQWVLQQTVIYGNGSTIGGGTNYSPVGWSIPLHHKFQVLVTPDPSWAGHIKDGTSPTLF